MIKPSDRTTLKTIDGQVITRPEATSDVILFDNCKGILNEEGQAAWNQGEEIEQHHLEVIFPLFFGKGPGYDIARTIF